MKKKGFTLIELLAVIIILAVISLIAVPIVINVIEKTKKASFEQTLNSVLKAADIYQVKEEVTGGITECRYFSFSSDVNEVTVRDDKTYYPLKNLNLKGKIPTEGELKICGYGITLEASDGSYAGSYDGNVINVNKGDLASNDFTTPIIDTFNVTTQLDRIIVSVLAHSPGIGGVISNYYYKINDGEYIKTTENSYIFDKLNANEKLTPNTEYTISIKVENKSGVIKEESKTVKTKAFGEITIDVENNGTWTTSKKVTLSGTTNEYEMEYMIEKYNPETDGNETSEFVKYENPFTLDTVATPLHPIIITVRYSSNGNYSDYKSYSVTKIDPTPPTTIEPAVNVSTTKPTSEASVVIRQEDLESGLDESTIEYGYSEEANGTYKWQTNALLTKLTSGKKYYVKTKVKNNVGLETESEIKEYTPGGINTCSVTPLQSGWTTNKDVQIKGSQTGTKLQYQVGATEDNSWVSIENNGTINITENTTVYCRLWDGTTAGAYGSGSVNQIDRTEPTIEINSNIPSYITKGDNYEISNYINVSYGASGGSYECSSNLNGKFSNLSSLDIGNHEITCTATGNTNLNSNTKTNLLVFNPDYISTKADDLIWTYSYDTNYREFYKTNSGWTLFSYATYMLPDSNGTIWTGPLLVSTNRDAVIYDTRVDYIVTAPPSTSFTYLGQMWYVSSGGAWFQGNSISTNGNAKKVYINANSASMEKAGQELIDIALKNTVQDSIEISQKSVNNSMNSISIDISLSTLDLSKISCYYGTSNGNYTNKCLYSTPAKDMSYTLSNSLSSNTTYYYKICASSMTGQEKCIINSAQTTAFKIGDYVQMTPTSTSYKIDSSLTGYTDAEQIINPSELNLWRVIRINSDGTIDMVSEYVSSKSVYFRGKTGYKNFVGSLNTIASQYVNTKYTTKTRHMGYNGQTATLTDTASTVDSLSTNPGFSTTSNNNNETKGGGDMLYQADFDLVNTAIGTRKAYKVGTTSSTIYWLASRRFIYSDSTRWYYNGQFIKSDGSLSSGKLAFYNSGSEKEISIPYAVRPIVTLKSGLTATGSGTSSSPYVLN